MIKISHEVPQLARRVLDSRITVVNKVTGKPLSGFNLTWTVNENIKGKGPKILVPKLPADKEFVTVAVVAHFPKLGTLEKTLQIPIPAGK